MDNEKKIKSNCLFKERTPSKNHIISTRKNGSLGCLMSAKLNFQEWKLVEQPNFSSQFSANASVLSGVFLLQIYQHLRTPECWMAFVDTCKRRWKLSPHVVQKNWVRNLICTVAKKDCSTAPNLHTALNLFQNVDYLSWFTEV